MKNRKIVFTIVIVMSIVVITSLLGSKYFLSKTENNFKASNKNNDNTYTKAQFSTSKEQSVIESEKN
ncbi:MAG TPA: hypothetical protein VF941_01155, partial [Clostridia bacterium]